MNLPLNATYKDTPVRVYHIENGSAYVVRPDGTATCCDWKVLRFPKDPALLPAVRWGEWVVVSEHLIRRPGVVEGGAAHSQLVVFFGDAGWAWRWRCGASIIHEQEGYSEREWARRDCEAYTAGKTAPVGPTPANAKEK